MTSMARKTVPTSKIAAGSPLVSLVIPQPVSGKKPTLSGRAFAGSSASIFVNVLTHINS
jgi:hypothetical protein